jgi:hypothetical protein
LNLRALSGRRASNVAARGARSRLSIGFAVAYAQMRAELNYPHTTDWEGVK